MCPPKTPTPAVRLVAIDDAHAGQRIDNFLLGQLKGVPKTHVYRLVRKGEVRVNKGRCQPDYRLQAGDVVRIPPVRQRADTKPAVTGDHNRFAWLETRILFEDDAFLAIDKPSGLAAHGGSGISIGLIEALRQLRPAARFLELVHRLDRETSGCLLIAKKRVALVRLHAMLRNDGLDKRYLALVRGVWVGKTRRIDAALEKNQLRSGERMVNVSSDGKAASSRFTPRQLFTDASLMEIRLFTGRTHQARVHAAHAGHPIAGDTKYGDKAFNDALRARGLRRLFLHASELRLRHPATEAPLVIRAPLGEELQTFLKNYV